MIFVIVVAIVIGASLGGIIAAQKNRSVFGWVLLGGLLPASVIALRSLPPLQSDPDTGPEQDHSES